MVKPHSPRESGTTNFGVSSSSTFSGAATYASVISGLATEYIGATRSGTVGGYSWELVLQSGRDLGFSYYKF